MINGQDYWKHALLWKSLSNNLAGTAQEVPRRCRPEYQASVMVMRLITEMEFGREWKPQQLGWHGMQPFQRQRGYIVSHTPAGHITNSEIQPFE